MRSRANLLGAIAFCVVVSDGGHAAAAATPREDTRPAVKLGASAIMASSVPTSRSAVTWNVGAAEHVPVKGYALVAYVPARVRLVNGAFDLVIHLHGSPEIQEGNLDRANVGAIVVTVNAGVVSGQYEKAYESSGAFAMFKQAAIDAAQKTGRFASPRIGHVGVSTWSAGFGALQAMASDPSANAMEEIDALLIADGIFTRWQDASAGTVRWQPIEFLLAFAERAKRGEKLLAITHTEIPTQGYPSMPEVMRELIREVGLTRSAAPSTKSGYKGGPTMFPASYRAAEGSLWITGHKGATFDAHNEELARMDRTMIPWLRDRWASEL